MTARDPARTAGREIRQRCVAGRVRKLSRVVTGIYDDHLRQHGIRAGQLTILAFAAAQDELSPSDLERHLDMDRSTVSRNVARMAQSGWLATVPTDDARRHAIVITPRGRRLLRDALPAWRHAQRRAREVLGADQFALLQTLQTPASPVGD